MPSLDPDFLDAIGWYCLEVNMKKVLHLVMISSLLITSSVTMAKYEEPDFQVIESQNDIQIRAYKPMIVAEVEVSGERSVAIKQGFRLLADYIFGNNQAIESSSTTSERIPMTTPVIQQKNEKIPMTTPVSQQAKNKNWVVQFVMPKSYTLKTLAKPNNPQVEIRELPAYKAVTIRFSGMSTRQNLQKHLTELRNFVSSHDLKVIDNPIYAFYNPPWTLPFLRRNEIILKLMD